MQRNGLVPENPGTGNIIRYSVSDVYDWALAIGLARYWMPPKIILKIVKAGIFQRFMAQMEMENKQNSLDHLLMLIFPDALYEGSGGDFIPYATEWKSRLPYAKLDVDYLTIDLTDLKARIDEALAPVMSRRMSRGAA